MRSGTLPEPSTASRITTSCTPRPHHPSRHPHTHLIKHTHSQRNHTNSGAITLIQRFGSAANLNTHLHALVLDGVYQATDNSEGAPLFQPASAPSSEQLQTLLDNIIRRIVRLLTRLGHLIEEEGFTYLALCVNAMGFTLHAGVHCEADDRQGIEHLARYITRPAISIERLSINREGNVVLKLKPVLSLSKGPHGVRRS